MFQDQFGPKDYFSSIRLATIHRLEIYLTQTVPNHFLARPHFLANERSAYIKVKLVVFHYLVDIFDDWSTRHCLVFNIYINKTTLLETSLWCCIR